MKHARLIIIVVALLLHAVAFAQDSPSGPLNLYGSHCASCQAPVFGTGGQITVSCTQGNGVSQTVNTINYDPDTPRLVVNNAVYPCSTDVPVQFPSQFSCDTRPASTSTLPWLYADNNNGTLVNLSCNVPVPQHPSLTWAVSQNVAQFGGADWSKLVEIKSGMTPESAQAYAANKDYITFFFYVNQTFSLATSNGNQTFNEGDAVFFAGGFWGGSATATTYVKQPSPLAVGLHNNIAAYYSFNVNTNDGSGAGNNAAPSGNLAYQLGYLGNAIGFPAGSNAQVTLPASLAGPQSSFSISTWIWVNNSAAGATGLASIVGPLYLDIAANQIVYRLTASGGNPQIDIRSGVTIGTGQWVNVAVSANAAVGVIDLYIDGALTTSTSVPGLANYNTIPWGTTIGGTSVPQGPVFTGAVDELFLYTRALNASEVILLARFNEIARHERHMHPQSTDTAGQPGYSARKACASHMFAPPLYWGVFDYSCTDWKEECNDGASIDQNGICRCPAGNQPITGGGCQAIPTSKSASLAVTSYSNTAGYVVSLQNASWAGFDVTDRDGAPSINLVDNFITTYCGTNPAKSPMSDECPTISRYQDNFHQDGVTKTCQQLALTKNDGTTQVNYPNRTVSEWGNLYVDSLVGANKKNPFVAINTNFWDPSIAPNNNPCGIPYGVLQRNGQISAIKSTKFDSMTIGNLSGKKTFTFTQAGAAPQPSTGAYTISGYLIRHQGVNISSSKGTNSFKQAKPKSCAGRTALAYSSSTDQLQVLVVPGDSKPGSCGTRMTVENVRTYFNNQKNGAGTALFDEILVLDGGGSSSMVYWSNGTQVNSAPQNVNAMRNVPTALILRQN